MSTQDTQPAVPDTHAGINPPEDGLEIRSFESQDQSAVYHLYQNGLLAGQIAANDTGADIDNIHEAYLSDERHHFWVAVLHGQVVGMIGVDSDERNTAEVRRLRVLPEFHSTSIPAAMLETAVEFCRNHEYLKVRLDTRFEKTEAVDLFDRTGFQHTRTRATEEKELLEFYLDLYRGREED